MRNSAQQQRQRAATSEATPVRVVHASVYIDIENKRKGDAVNDDDE